MAFNGLSGIYDEADALYNSGQIDETEYMRMKREILNKAKVISEEQAREAHAKKRALYRTIAGITAGGLVGAGYFFGGTAVAGAKAVGVASGIGVSPGGIALGVGSPSLYATPTIIGEAVAGVGGAATMADVTSIEVAEATAGLATPTSVAGSGAVVSTGSKLLGSVGVKEAAGVVLTAGTMLWQQDEAKKAAEEANKRRLEAARNQLALLNPGEDKGQLAMGGMFDFGAMGNYALPIALGIGVLYLITSKKKRERK